MPLYSWLKGTKCFRYFRTKSIWPGFNQLKGGTTVTDATAVTGALLSMFQAVSITRRQTCSTRCDENTFACSYACCFFSSCSSC